MLLTHRALLKSVSRHFSQFENAFYAAPKPRTKVIRKYEALPPTLEIEPKDPFDYPLRSKQSVEEFLKNRPKKIPYSFKYEFHLLTAKEQAPTDRFMVGSFKVGDLDLTQKQKERLIFLCKERYNKRTDTVKIRVDSFLTKEENFRRLEEIMEELYMETLRAP